MIGTAVTLLGVIFLVLWWYELLFVIRGILPIMMILGGGIAIAAGYSELKDILNSKETKK